MTEKKDKVEAVKAEPKDRLLELCNECLDDMGNDYNQVDWHKNRDLISREIGIRQRDAELALTKAINLKSIATQIDTTEAKLKEYNELWRDTIKEITALEKKAKK